MRSYVSQEELMPESRVRDLVNDPRRLHALRADAARWNMVCAALDAIGDTQLAIDAYKDGQLTADSDGAMYVALYGILQVLYTQQDAVRDLYRALGLEFKLPANLRQVREARNASIGHPTSYDYGKYSNTISRNSITLQGFELYLWPEEGDPEVIRHIDVAQLCADQSATVQQMLGDVAMALENEERQHRTKWRADPLVKKLDDGILYAFEKLSEGTWKPPAGTMAAWGLSAIQERLDRFKEALTERGVAGAYTSIDRIFEELEYPLGRLKEYMDGIPVT